MDFSLRLIDNEGYFFVIGSPTRPAKKITDQIENFFQN